MKTLIAVLALFLCAPLCSQEIDTLPNGFVVRHVDGSLTTLLDAEVPDENPQLTTTWTDAKGVTHSVSTPIASTTPAGLNRAVQTHQALVTTLQGLYPPKPV